MDMFASIHSKNNHAIQLDCRSLAYDYVPLQMEGISILLIDTCLKHELASSAYNTRREECESVVEHFQRKGVQASTLRDITFEMLSSAKNEIDPICYQRAAFVLAENKRVSLFAEAMRQANWSMAGMQMAGSHAGLRDEYEVSCAELDHLVDISSQTHGVLGSRMMGGGFGGCTINLVKTESLNHVIEKTSSSYKNAFGVEPKYYIATTGNGACEL
jgi:galactokinase